MNITKLLLIILIILLLIIGIETIIKFKTNADRLIEDVKKPLLVRINIIIVLTIGIAILSIIYIVLSNKQAVVSGINNYDKKYFIEKYRDLDSNLSVFPDNNKFEDASFSSSMYTSLFDTDGYILLKVKYNTNDFNNEISRIKSLSMNIYSSCYGEEGHTNYIKYDEESYLYPAYITIDGFDNKYEYVLINKDEFEIIYLYLAYPDINNTTYNSYLKKDKSIYSINNTLKMYSMYNYSFDNNSFREFDDC